MNIVDNIKRIATAKKSIKEVVNQDFDKIADDKIDTYSSLIDETIEEYKNYIPTEKVTGESINIINAAPLSIKNGVIYPTEESKQETTEGKNICPSSIDSWESGQYNENGIKTNIVSRIRLADLLEIIPGQSYYFNLFSDNYKFIIRHFDENKNFLSNRGAVNNDINITFPETVHFVGISIYNFTNELDTFSSYQSLFENDDIKPLICLSGEKTKNFEKYTGKQASPNPNYPQRIETITSITLHACGKNLWDGISEKFIGAESNNWYDLTGKSNAYNNGYIIQKQMHTRFLKAGTYYVSTAILQNATNLQLIDIDGNIIASTLNQRFTLNKDTYVLPRCRVADPTIKTYVVIQIEFGNEATEYEKFKGHQSASIDLQGNEIVKLSDNVEDELIIDKKGNVSLVKNTRKRIVTSTDNFIKIGTANYCYQLSTALDNALLPSTSSVVADIKSNYFIHYSADKVFGNSVAGIGLTKTGLLNIGFGLESEITSSALLKNWLDEHELKLYYPLETSETISLGNLSSLIKTYEGINNIWIESNLGTTIELEYYRDYKLEEATTKVEKESKKWK